MNYAKSRLRNGELALIRDNVIVIRCEQWFALEQRKKFAIVWPRIAHTIAIFSGMILLSCHTEGDNANDLSHSRAKPSASVQRV